MADADQAFGQDMDQKAAQELIGGNGHDLVLAAVSILSSGRRRDGSRKP